MPIHHEPDSTIRRKMTRKAQQSKAKSGSGEVRRIHASYSAPEIPPPAAPPPSYEEAMRQDGAYAADTLPPGWKKVTSKKQLWRFLYDNESLLVLRSHQNKWLCAEEDGVTITNNRQAIGPWEQFQIIVTSDGHLSLKTWKGKYLSCQPNGQLEANKKVAGPREKFEMFMFGDEKAALRSWSGTWLSARPDGRMEMNSHELGLWEMFYGCKEGSYDDWTPTPHNFTIPNEQLYGTRLSRPGWMEKLFSTEATLGDRQPEVTPLTAEPAGWKRVTNTNQLWRFLKPLDNSMEFVVLRSHHNRWLCAENDSYTVTNNRMEVKRWEQFEILFPENGFVSLKTWKSKYLSAQPNGKLEANRDAIKQWEKFEMFISGDKKVAFKSTHGKWLSAQPDGLMEVNRDVLNIWEMFYGWKEGNIDNWRPIEVYPSQIVSGERVDAFVRGTDNALWHKWYDNGKWGKWEKLGGILTDDPNAVSWGPNRIDVFVKGTDQAMWHKWWSGKWSEWESLGGILTSAPTVSSWAPKRLDTFCKGTDNELWHKWWYGKWSDWEKLGAPPDKMTSAPAAASWGPNRIDVFTRGGNNHMWHKWWSGKWSGWEDLGGILTSSPTVCSWGANRLDTFVRGTDNKLWHKCWNGKQWSQWKNLGAPPGDMKSAPGAASRRANHIDVFTQGGNRHLWHKWWDGTKWSDWEDLEGILTSAPCGASWTTRIVTVPSGWIKVTSTNQLWRFLHPLEDSTQCIVLRSHHNRWLCAENDAKTVSNNRMEIKRWEKFEIIFTKDGFVNLKTWKNKYLSAQRNGQLEANRDAANGWEKFEMFISGDTKVGFRSTHGKWLSAQPDGRMEVNRDVLNIWEMFHGWKEGPASNWKPVAVKVTVPSGWEKVTNTNKLWRFLHPLEDSTQCIVLRSHHNRWLCAENDAKTVSNNRMEINRWEKFEIIFTKDGFVNLKTWKNKYLSAQRNGQLEANRDAANGWEKFEMFISGDAKVGFRSTHGKWLSAQPDGRMEVNRDVLNRWEMFHGWKEGPASNWEPVSVKLTVPAGWVKVTSTNQLWRFLDPLEDSTQCIVLRSHHNRWLSAENDTKTISNDRREIKRWEKFEIIFTKDGFVNLKTWKNKYLSAQPNGQLEANRDSAKGWEKFEMFISGDTKVGFRSTHGKWLSAQPDGRMEVNRDVLNIWEMFHGWKTGPASNWKPVSVNPTVPSGWEKVTNMSKLWRFLNPLEDSTQCIVLRSHHNKWLCAENDAKTISNNRVEIKRWEKFEIIFTKDGLVNLKTWKNKYLSAQSNGKLEANRDVARGWESFEMLISGDTKVAFRSTHGKWLSAQPDGQMEANRDVLNIWEMFHGWKEGSASNWKPVSLTSDVPEGWNKVSSKRQLGRFMIGLSGPASDGDDYIVLKSHHGKWLCAEEDAFTITNSRTEPKRWEKFDIVFVEDGIVALRTWKGKFLSARPNGTLEANREWLRGDEKFHMFIYKDEKVAFRSERGKWLSAQPDGRMEFNRDKLSIWETFYGLK